MQVFIVAASLVACCVAQLAQPPPGWYPSGRALLLPIKEEPTPTPQAEEKKAAQILDSGEYYVLLENGKLQMVKYSTSALKEEDDKPAGQLKQEQPQQAQPQQAQSQPQQAQYPVYYLQYQQPQQAQPQQSQPQQAQPQQSQPQQAQYPVYYPQYQQPQQFQQPKQFQQPQQNQQPQSSQAQQYRSAPAAGSSPAAQPAGSEPFAKFQLQYVQYPFSGPQFAQTKEQKPSPESEPEDDAEEKKDEAEQPSGYEAKLQYRDVKPISAPIYANNPTPLVRILKK